ncbi:unnamed protein product, partial [Hapterophycus canaliculatus]
LPLIFTSDPEVLTAIAPVIVVVSLLQPLNAFVFVGDGILQGTQDFVYEVRQQHDAVVSAYSDVCLGFFYQAPRTIGVR